MNDDEELLRVRPSEPSKRLEGRATAGRESSDRHQRHHDEHPHRRSGDYFHTLAKAAEETNQRLERSKTPFRFCVYYDERGRVMLDVVELDSQGGVRRTVRRDITDEDFDRWIDDIANGEGLLLDSTR